MGRDGQSVPVHGALGISMHSNDEMDTDESEDLAADRKPMAPFLLGMLFCPRRTPKPRRHPRTIEK